MASLTGQTIASTYDALLKITDNGPITASLKQITDGLGNNTPLYLSATTVFVDGNFRAGGAFFDVNNNPGTAGQFLVSTGTGVDWQDISESNLINGTGTAGFLSKFTASGTIANSVIQESGNNIGIGVSPTQKLHVNGNGLFTGSITASNVSGSTSGVNTGDETNASIKTKLGAATSVNDGYLTAVDHELFTNKVPLARTITINGDTQDLSANRTFNVNVGVTSFNTRTGAVVLSSSDVTTALGYTPALESRIMTINGVGYSLAADRSWSVGTVTSVGTSAPLTGGTITGAGTIGITQANASTDGYLSSTDWNTFNDKQAALGFTPENSANKGIANGYASLDGAGKVPSTQLPSYVDDVVEVANFAALPATGETGKIYITLDTNFVYRWSGSVYVKISEPNAVWGSITGTLSNQTDLQSALDGKVDDATTLTINGVTSDLSANRTFNVGTVTSVSGTGSVSGLSLSGSVTGSGSLTLGGTLSLTSSDVTTGLGYTPVTNARTLSINGTAFDLTANRSWNVGTVTSVGLELGTTGTDANIANSPITSSGNITLNLPTASASNRGLLSAANWTTFNNKQNAITLTTTGNSGSATFVGSTLNIPTYTLAGLGGQPLLTNPVTGTGTSGYLTRFTGGTTVGNSVIFDNGSQIGIGTASPASTLNVAGGNITVSAGFGLAWSGDQTRIMTPEDNVSGALIQTPGIIRLSAGGSERMRITSGGLVGIGTSAPATRTHFVGGGTTTSAANAATTVTSRFDVANPAVSLGIGYVSTDMPMIQAFNNGTGNSSNLIINPFGGAIGIGNTNPTHRFVIGDGSGTGNQYLRIWSSASDIFIGQSGSGLFGMAANSGQYVVADGVSHPMGIGTIAAQPVIFGTQNTEKMRITSAGNVGIGTTNPGVLLHSNPATNTNLVTALFTNGITDPNFKAGFANGSGTAAFTEHAKVGMWYGTSGNPVCHIGFLRGGSADSDGMTFNVNNTERMRITSGGNLLVAATGLNADDTGVKLFGQSGSLLGTIAQSKDYSSGTILYTSFETATPSATQVGSITYNGSAVSYNTSSDYRLKEDLKDFSGVDLVKSIGVYDVKWKSNESRSHAVIAHELAEVLPYAVTGEKDGEQMQGVDYSKLVPVLIKAIQELTEKVNQLENK